MTTNNVLFIDIRNGDEVLKHSITNHEVLNIPMNMIRFNISNLEKIFNNYDLVILICYSSSRSKFIYDKYFKKNDILQNVIYSKELQFKNLKAGDNIFDIENFGQINVQTTKPNKFNLYNLTRVIQLLLGIIIISCSLFIYFLPKYKLVFLIILFIFGFNAIFNSLTNTCTISLLFRNQLN